MIEYAVKATVATMSSPTVTYWAGRTSKP